MADVESGAIRAFVIGPIGDKDAPAESDARRFYEEGIQVFEEVIQPACTSLDVDAFRADFITRTGEIPEQIFRNLRDAPVVVADLTGANPNVMYELGLRHTTGKLTIQIGERERLPFDVSAIRTIVFKRTEAGLVEARRKLISALATGLESGGDHVSATRVWFENSLTFAADSSGAVVDVTDDEDEPGFLEKLADAELGIASLAHSLSTVTAITSEMGSLFTGATEMVKGLRGGGTPTERLALANRLAVLLEDPATRLSIAASEYDQSVARAEPGLIYMLDRVAEDPGQLAGVPEFLPSMRSMVSGAQTSLPKTLAFKKMTEEIGRASRPLRKVTTKISAALQLIATASDRVAAWDSKLDGLG